MGFALIFLVPLAAFVAWWLWERSHRKTHAVSPGLQVAINLPHAAEFELYHNALSLCSKKTRFCLAELGINYVGHHVHLIETGGYENIGRAFLTVNPAGVVPVLVHDGHPIYESHEQIRYAADHAPEGAPSLVPSDPAAEAEMQEWVDRSSLVGDDPIAGAKRSAGNAVPGLTVPLFSSMMEEIPVHWIFEGLLFHRLKIRPVLFLTLKSRGLRGLPKLPPAVKAIQACGRAMNTHLDDLEAHLEKSGGPWILGEAFTLADVSWVVVVERLREADSLHVFLGEGRRPAVTAWWERILFCARHSKSSDPPGRRCLRPRTAASRAPEHRRKPGEVVPRVARWAGRCPDFRRECAQSVSMGIEFPPQTPMIPDILPGPDVADPRAIPDN